MNNVSRVKKNKKIYGQKVVVKSYKIHKIVFVILFISLLCNALTIYHFATFNHHKVKIVTKTKIKKETVVPENIVFLGDSLTHRWDLDKAFPGHNIVNSGYDAHTTENILSDMKGRVYEYNPSKVILLIGTNDIHRGFSDKKIIDNIKKILDNIKSIRPQAKIYVESLYPVEEGTAGAEDRTNDRIKEVNEKIKSLCNDEKITYIDVYDSLLDKDKKGLEDAYTKDGLHMNDKGYDVIKDILDKYVNEKI